MTGRDDADQFRATPFPLSVNGDGLKSLEARVGPAAVVPSRLAEKEEEEEEEAAWLRSDALGRDGPAIMSVSARLLASAVLPTGR